MINDLVISDAGPIFSLAIIDKLNLLNAIFHKISIPKAVWEEITKDKTVWFYKSIHSFFKDKIVEIKGFNELVFMMDLGESEAVILYKELDASFLLIDDKKARKIAETLSINCVGILGILVIAKKKGYINDLKSIFQKFLQNKRYYSIDLLNTILINNNETILNT